MSLDLNLTVNLEFGAAKWFTIPNTEYKFLIEAITAKESVYLYSGVRKVLTAGNSVVKDGKKNAAEIDPVTFFEKAKDILLKKIKNFSGFKDQNGEEVKFDRKNLEKLLDFLWMKPVATKLDENGKPELDEDGKEIELPLYSWLIDCAADTKNYIEGDEKNS